MTNKILLGVCLLFAAVVNVQAQDFYVAPSVVYTDDDEERATDDGIGGGQIAIGQFINDNLAVEGLLGWSSFDGYNEVTTVEVSANGLLMFRRGEGFSPYLLGGLGLMSTDNSRDGDETALLLNAGAGVNLNLGDHPGVLRLEYRLRMADGGGQSWTDHLLSLGVMVPFGD